MSGQAAFVSTYFRHFRNLGPQRRDWSPGFNLVAGHNGAGKTNFIEALSLLSGWGPLTSGEKLSSLIRWQEDGNAPLSASLWARFITADSAGQYHDIHASIQTRSSLKLCDKPVTASALRMSLPVMTFLPGDLALLRGGASFRRSLLDRIGSLISPSYARRLYDYRTLLRQKSALLRRRRDPHLAELPLVPIAAWLWNARESITAMLREALPSYADLQATPLSVSFLRGGGGRAAVAQDDMRISLAELRERECAAKMALVGPQRDDLQLLCAGRPAREVLSQGQSRRAAAALILSAALVVERRIGRRPILLFDELYSELDEEGRRSVAAALIATKTQVFATTVEALPLPGINLHKMSQGRFTE